MCNTTAMSSAVLPIRDQVRLWGPGSGTHLGPGESVAYCRALAGDHYENFSVLSSLVPRSLRDDFAAVYAFCRWSDDLSDEIGDPERSRELLGWWRSELEGCFAGSPTHPVMCALEATIRRHELPERPFHDLIDAFVQDQEFTRYETWTQLLHYCSRSAAPVALGEGNKEVEELHVLTNTKNEEILMQVAHHQRKMPPTTWFIFGI